MDYVGMRHEGRWIYRPAARADIPVDAPSPAKILSNATVKGGLKVRLDDGWSGTIMFQNGGDLGVSVAHSGPGSDGVKIALTELASESPCMAMFEDGSFILGQYLKKGHYKAIRLPESVKGQAIILTPTLRFYSVTAAQQDSSNVLRVHDNKHVCSWLTKQITGKDRFDVQHFADSFTIDDSRLDRKYVGKLKSTNHEAAAIEVEDIKYALSTNGIAPIAFTYDLRRG